MSEALNRYESAGNGLTRCMGCGTQIGDHDKDCPVFSQIMEDGNMSEPQFCALCGSNLVAFDKENHASGIMFHCTCEDCKQKYTLIVDLEEEA